MAMKVTNLGHTKYDPLYYDFFIKARIPKISVLLKEIMFKC